MGFERVEFDGIEHERRINLEKRVHDWVGNLDELHVHFSDACARGVEVWNELGLASSTDRNCLMSTPALAASRLATLEANEAWLWPWVAPVCCLRRARNLRLWPT